MPKNCFKTQRREGTFVKTLTENRKVRDKLVEQDLDGKIHNVAY